VQYLDQIFIFLDAATPAAYVSPEGDTLGITPLLERAPHLDVLDWLQTVPGYAGLRGDCDVAKSREVPPYRKVAPWKSHLLKTRYVFRPRITFIRVHFRIAEQLLNLFAREPAGA
jgi:hypothetical protein